MPLRPVSVRLRADARQPSRMLAVHAGYANQRPRSPPLFLVLPAPGCPFWPSKGQRYGLRCLESGRAPWCLTRCIPSGVENGTATAKQDTGANSPSPPGWEGGCKEEQEGSQRAMSSAAPFSASRRKEDPTQVPTC